MLGTKQQGEYVNGIKEGKWTYWYNHDQVKTAGKYLNGAKDGKWTEWTANNKITPYFDAEGRLIFYDWGTNTKREGNYLNGVKDGKWTYWFRVRYHCYSFVRYKLEGTYVNGELVGQFTYWTQYHTGGAWSYQNVDSHNYFPQLPTNYFNPLIDKNY